MLLRLHVKIFVFLLICKHYSFIGNECKQIINEHFFDMSPLESQQDYLHVQTNEDETSTQIYFNFCRPVIHSCEGTDPEYHMMVATENTCTYYKQVPDDIDYGAENGGNNVYLISKKGEKVGDGIYADGIASLFQGEF